MAFSLYCGSFTNKRAALTMESDLKRDDVARKSFRIPAHKTSKRLAPMPPPRQDLPSRIVPTIEIFQPNKLKQVEQINKINLNMNNKNAQMMPINLAARPCITDDLQKLNEMDNVKLCIADDETNEVMIRSNIEEVLPSQLSSIDVLEQLGKQIFKMEKDSINTSSNSGPIASNQMVQIANRYGNHENLLNTGISNVASNSTGLCCESPDSDNKTIDFNRENVYRKSTGGDACLTTKLLQKPTIKTIKPINRTASDTKKVENSVKMLRLGIKKQDEINNEQMHLPLNNKKKEDTIILTPPDISVSKALDIKQRQIDEKFRPTITQRANQIKISRNIEKVSVFNLYI